MPISAGRPGTVKAVQEALEGDRRLFAVSPDGQCRDIDQTSPKPIFNLGCAPRGGLALVAAGVVDWPKPTVVLHWQRAVEISIETGAEHTIDDHIVRKRQIRSARLDSAAAGTEIFPGGRRRSG